MSGIQPRGSTPGTFEILSKIVEILGTTTTTFFPGLESIGTIVPGIGGVGRNLTPSDESTAIALEAEFVPQQHTMGVYSYYINSGAENHLAGTDNNAYSFGNGTVDTPFSMGLWAFSNDIGTARSLIAKYDLLVEEYDLRVTDAGLVQLELHDASGSGSETATSTTALTVGRWYSVIVTYDGTETAPVVNIYINGLSDNDGSTVESGTYVAMENSATPLLVGARDLTATPLQGWDGRLALPFITGQELTATEVSTIHNLGNQLLGL